MQTIELNKTNVAKLETNLRALIETERQSFVDFFFARTESNIAYFLEKRAPNQTVEEFYGQFLPEGVREALVIDPEAIKAQIFRLYNRNQRPAFAYNRRPDATEIVQLIAERRAEEVLQMFVNRAMEKLGPVVERKGEYTIEKTTSAYSGFERATGAWEGVLTLTFDDNTHFGASLKIITNYSKYHVPYGQYPMRFYDCALDATAEQEGRMGAASIEEIWASVGYVPTPPAKRARWAAPGGKLTGGSVVQADGKFYLLQTPGAAKKLGLTDFEQVARIEKRSKGAVVQYADTTEKFYAFTDGELASLTAMDQAYDYDKAKFAGRQFAFDALFGEG